jgi:1-acyl-sn-glycerol-3-phosphate acyltransferase
LADARRDELDRRGEFRPWFYRLVRAVGTPIVRGVFRMRAEGVEHVPATGGVVIASQHRSNFDAYVIGLPLHRPLRFMAKAELYRLRPMAWILRSGGAFKVEREKSDIAAVDRAIGLLEEGWAVAIYPEGTRGRKGKPPPRPRSGAARIAISAGVPMIPVAIRGTDRVRLLPPRFPRFEARFGRPLEVDDLAELPLRDAARALTNRWEAAIAELQAGFESASA